MPGPLKVCDGFWVVAVLVADAGSPKFQLQLVGPLAEKSVKVIGEPQEVRVLGVNAATGASVFGKILTE